MKKFAILLIGAGAVALGALLLSLTGCNMPQWIGGGDTYPENAPDVAADLVYGYRVIKVGETFPETAVKAPESAMDRSYLGLNSDADFSIRDIQADLVLVEMINIHCSHCQTQAPVYNNLFALIDSDTSSRDQIKMLAVGVGNTQAEIEKFRKEYQIPFPIVPDPRLDLHKRIGKPGTPFSALVRLVKSPDTAVVASTYSGVHEDYESIYQDMSALKTLDLAALRERGSQAETTVRKVEPPQPLPEVEAQIKDAMKKITADGGNFIEFRKLAIKDRHAYIGTQKTRDGIKKLFAEVVSRPTLCDVCHDVHFFYLFDEKGAVIDFVPLQLTKWGNKEWSDEDVQRMRDRLKGRFIFTPFYFNPELDAVTSATITSAVIFDALSQGKELFEFLKQQGLIS